jgi:hypothetical protein
MFRPIYDEEAIILKWDTAATSAEGTSVTATNYTFVSGSEFSLQLPISLSAHGGLNIQANNSNRIRLFHPLLPSASNAGYYSRSFELNPSFTANWITIATMDNGIAFRSLNGVTCRYLRISGAGLTAAGMEIYFWSNLNAKGT